MSKISPQSKSFIALFGAAVVLTYVCLLLWANLSLSLSNTSNYAGYNLNASKTPDAAQSQAQAVPAVDTSNWKTYTDKQDGLSFSYEPDWKVLTAQNKNGFKILQIDPGAKYYNFKIYINPKQFYIMDGLPSKTETIDGQPALNVGNALYGILANNMRYTFDIGYSMTLIPNFDAMVHSVKFK
jgi:hypothetical protein